MESTFQSRKASPLLPIDPRPSVKRKHRCRCFCPRLVVVLLPYHTAAADDADAQDPYHSAENFERRQISDSDSTRELSLESYSLKRNKCHDVKLLLPPPPSTPDPLNLRVRMLVNTVADVVATCLMPSMI